MSPSIRPAKKKNGRILIVDDEPAVARSTARAIGRDHEVVVELDSRHARERLLSGEPFDLILCDLAMPVLSGRELYTTVAAARPDLAPRFVFVTGGTFTPESRAFVESLPNPCLIKPFAIDDLRAILHERVPPQPSKPPTKPPSRR